jgi:hypothetical protein
MSKLQTFEVKLELCKLNTTQMSQVIGGCCPPPGEDDDDDD